MAQLFAQQDRQPDVWVMSGAPTATVVYLSLQTTINYSSGSPDTLPPNTPALIYGTSDTAFDRSLDVWVPFTVRASGVLSIIKESLLATITADYVAMARVELHGIKPYQPEPYLASGGFGSSAPSTITSPVSDTTAKALSLWTGSTNSSPPAGWETTGFDDSAWSAAAIALGGLPLIWPEHGQLANTEQALTRQHFTLPAGTITAASLTFVVDDSSLGVWINGVAISGTVVADMLHSGGARTVSVSPSALMAGADNLIAVRGANIFPTGAGIEYSLSVTYTAPGISSAPAEGDLLYYHSGAWTDLPISTSGTVLTSDGTDPGWASLPAGASGTVTSVALSGPTGTTVGGSPVTASGTLTLSWASQSANTVLAAPAGSSGAPTFRALQGSDLPAATGAGGKIHAHGHFI